MKLGDLVECPETERIGLIIDIRRTPHTTMVLVKWKDEVKWVDAIDVDLFDY